MRSSITLGLFLGAVLVVSAATIGCRDSNATAPQPVLDNQSGTSGGDGDGGGGDSSSTPEVPNGHAPVEPAPGPDSAISPPPPLPASFTLKGVALGAESRSDTTRTVRLAGVTARIYRVKAADGSAVAETLVGTATSNANGEFVFRELASAYYRLDVTAPAGGLYADASRKVAPPWSTEIGVYVLLLRKS